MEVEGIGSIDSVTGCGEKGIFKTMIGNSLFCLAFYIFLGLFDCITQGWESSGFRWNSGFLMIPGVIIEIRLNFESKIVCVYAHYNRELLTPCAPATIMSAILFRFSLS